MPQEFKMLVHRVHDKIYDTSFKAVCELRNIESGEYIVTAINSHDRLVNALDWAERELSEIYNHARAMGFQLSNLKEVRETLIFAKGDRTCSELPMA